MEMESLNKTQRKALAFLYEHKGEVFSGQNLLDSDIEIGLDDLRSMAKQKLIHLDYQNATKSKISIAPGGRAWLESELAANVLREIKNSREIERLRQTKKATTISLLSLIVASVSAVVSLVALIMTFVQGG